MIPPMIFRATGIIPRDSGESYMIPVSIFPAGIFCRLQVAGCGLKFNYNWKTAGTKDTYIHQGFLHNIVGVFHMVKTRATSSFGKYIQQPFQMIFQMFSGYFR